MVYRSGQDLTALYCKECVASATTFVRFQLLFADWLHTLQAVKDTSATFSSAESRQSVRAVCMHVCVCGWGPPRPRRAAELRPYPLIKYLSVLHSLFASCLLCLLKFISDRLITFPESLQHIFCVCTLCVSVCKLYIFIVYCTWDFVHAYLTMTWVFPPSCYLSLWSHSKKFGLIQQHTKTGSALEKRLNIIHEPIFVLCSFDWFPDWDPEGDHKWFWTKGLFVWMGAQLKWRSSLRLLDYFLLAHWVRRGKLQPCTVLCWGWV